MKNLFFAAVAFLMVAGFASCTKTQTTVAEPGMASVMLTLEVNTDMTNDTTANGNFQTQYEFVPAGTTIQFVVDGSDLQLNPVAGKNYEDVIYTADVTSNGMVMIELPATVNPTTVTVRYPDLVLTEITDQFNATTGNMEKVMEEVLYTRSNSTISIWDGATIIREWRY
jgi:hypothetical protein